jgi:hypothetical protein
MTTDERPDTVGGVVVSVRHRSRLPEVGVPPNVADVVPTPS